MEAACRNLLEDLVPPDPVLLSPLGTATILREGRHTQTTWSSKLLIGEHVGKSVESTKWAWVGAVIDVL